MRVGEVRAAPSQTSRVRRHGGRTKYFTNVRRGGSPRKRRRAGRAVANGGDGCREAPSGLGGSSHPAAARVPLLSCFQTPDVLCESDEETSVAQLFHGRSVIPSCSLFYMLPLRLLTSQPEACPELTRRVPSALPLLRLVHLARKTLGGADAGPRAYATPRREEGRVAHAFKY